MQIRKEDERAALIAAYRHDIGKAHPAFQNMLLQAMSDLDNYREELWAKSDMASTTKPCYFIQNNKDESPRPLFRHELASMLSWLVLHPDDAQVYLIAYIIAAHHGKVRMGIRAKPGEAEPPDPATLFARGVWDGDHLPQVKVNGQEISPPVTLHLDIMQLGESNMGPSWTARTRNFWQLMGLFTWLGWRLWSDWPIKGQARQNRKYDKLSNLRNILIDPEQ